MKEITDLQREMLKKYNLDAMVTMTPENITYVTGAYIPTQVTVRSRKVIHIITEKHDPVVIVVNLEEPIMRAQSWMDPKSIISYNEFTQNPMMIAIDKLKGFGMEVVANDLFPDPQYAAEAGIAYVPLDELYARADIVSLHCPLTDRTRYMIGDAAISRMKPGVILINTGRGQLIHTEALIDGLKEKKIGAAGLDVYEEEAGYFYEDTSDRIMDDDVLARLLSFNNVIVTSHQGFFTREAVDNIARTTMQNIKDFSECRRLENEVRAEPENAVGQL